MWCITHNGYYDYYMGPTLYMNKRKEAFKRYHSELKTANDAFIHHFISYEEWHDKLEQLIEELENTLNNL